MLFQTVSGESNQIISPTEFEALGTITLGHFAEENGDHYVVLSAQSFGIGK